MQERGPIDHCFNINQMNFEELKPLALAEARRLEQFITEDEKDRFLLMLELFEPHSEEDCIYGLLTGGCKVPRALDLFDKCADKFFDIQFEHQGDKPQKIISVTELEIGKKDRERIGNGTIGSEGVFYQYSALETWILMPEFTNSHLQELTNIMIFTTNTESEI